MFILINFLEQHINDATIVLINTACTQQFINPMKCKKSIGLLI